MTGLFIALEGIGGSGKSTQQKKIAALFQEKGYEVVITREPGGTQGAEHIRTLVREGFPHEKIYDDKFDPMGVVLLFNAARIDHYNKVIKPAVDAGKIVICDRFCDSTFVYQSIVNGIDLEKLKLIHESTVNIYPDLTFHLDCDVETAMNRVSPGEKAGDRFDQAGIDQQKEMATLYKVLAFRSPYRYLTLDANLSPDGVFDETGFHRKFFDELLGILEVRKAFGGEFRLYAPFMDTTNAGLLRPDVERTFTLQQFLRDGLDKQLWETANELRVSISDANTDVFALSKAINQVPGNGNFFTKYMALNFSGNKDE